jgi:hypothetical protein
MTAPDVPRPELRYLVAVPTGGPPLPALDVEGWDLSGRRCTTRLASPGSWTLLLFLDSHCHGCQPFWALARAPAVSGLEPGDGVVVVTRGPERERREELESLIGEGLAETPGAIVMSDSAWVRYRVHGAPFFVLLDGVRVVCEGVAWSVEQVVLDAGRARRGQRGEARSARHARR